MLSGLAQRPFLLITVGALSGILCSCVPQENQLRPDINRVERAVEDVRSFQNEQTSRIEALEGALKELSGRVEQLEYSQTQKVGGELSDLKKDVTTLRKRVPPPPIVPVAALESDESLVGSLDAEIGRSFGEALANLREGSFEEALPLLRDSFDRAFADGNQASANILFWTGVAYDGLGDNKKALTAYNEIVARFPKNPRTALALLREGSVFVRLGDSKTAKLTYKKLIAEFPKSSEAAQAKEKMRSL